MHRRSLGDAIDARFVEPHGALFLAVEADDVIAVTLEAAPTLTEADTAAPCTSTTIGSLRCAGVLGLGRALEETSFRQRAETAAARAADAGAPLRRGLDLTKQTLAAALERWRGSPTSHPTAACRVPI